MPLKTTPDTVHVVRQTAADVEGMFIADPENMQGCLVYVADEATYYSLSLTSGLPLESPRVLPTMLGGDSRWLLTNIQPVEPPEPTMADYVIVGLGSAGAPLARFLSEDMTTSVVVLEAGEYRENDPEVQQGPPFGNPSVGVDPRYSFTRASNPADINPGLEATFPYSDGRMWGGGSSHNGLVAVRGAASDYAPWATVDAQWSYANLLPVMKFLETYTSNGSPVNLAERGVAGPLYVTQDNALSADDFYASFITASNAPAIDDYNDGTTPVGTGPGQWTSSNAAHTAGGLARRSDVVLAFLPNSVVTVQPDGDGEGVGDRKLDIVSRATVSSLIIENTDGGPRVTGVRYFVANAPDQVLTVTANTKVILCAGTIGNAAILQRSGIGPAALLGNLGIPVVLANDNVGQNMQNHYGPICAMAHDGVWNPPFELMESYIDESGSNPGPAFGRDGYTLPQANDGIRRTQVTSLPGTSIIPHAIVTALGISEDPNDVVSLITFLFSSTQDNGTVRIVSIDPNTPPQIAWGFYQLPQEGTPDLDRAVNLYKLMANVSQQYSIDRGVDLPMLYPPVDHFPAPYGGAPDDSLLESDAKDVQLIAAYHGVGTCRMSADASTGVVDGDLDVHGVLGLACADCSVMPAIPSGNTNLPSIIVGLLKAKIEGATVPY